MKKLLCALMFCFTIAGTSNAQAITEIETIIEKGIRLYDDGLYQAAIEQYKQALQLDSKSPEANYELALAYFAIQDMSKAIQYSDAVIKLRIAEPELRAQAHVNKGNALDVSGKQEKAIKEYQKAIKLAPRHYMAYYNLGLTYYNQKNYQEAEQHLTRALQLNPGHSSSHLLLSYTKQAQQQRVQSLLALYNFLLLEPDSKRAPAAYELLQQMQREGVSKGDGNAIKITVSADKLEDTPFSAADLMVSMTQASNSIEAKEGKTPEQLFFENTASFFQILGELREEKEDFWWSYYVEFFHKMLLDKNVEAFSYYISQSKSGAAENWLEEHPDKVEQLASWYKNYKR